MDERMAKAYSILENGNMPMSVSKETFIIPSQSGKGKYKVTSKNSWSCTCPDFKYRKLECKHILSIKLWMKLKQKISSEDTLELENELTNKPKCAYCNSVNLKENGNRKTKSGLKQRYYCKDCKRTFIADKEFEKIKANPKIVTLTMDLYFKGLSLRDISDTIYQFYGLRISHETIRNWIMRFTKSMDNYVKKFEPQLSNVWHVDEQMIMSKGKWLWSWNLLDEATRFLVANEITDRRNIKDARQVFKNAKEIVGYKPDVIISDGLATYEKAIRKEYSPRQRKFLDVKHVKLDSIRAKANNNILERYHGTFREFDKVRRGFKGQEKGLTDGFITYYNFIRNHSGIGTTPAQASGIELNLERNRWLSLLRKSLNPENQIKN